VIDRRLAAFLNAVASAVWVATFVSTGWPAAAGLSVFHGLMCLVVIEAGEQ
jgi:hypothetical protein